MSTVYDCSDPKTRETGIIAADSALKASRLVVLPTDTLYGLGCDAFDQEAVADLLRIKGRGPDMPVPVLVGSWHTIDGLVLSVPAEARTLIRAFWPGGLSLIVEQAPSLPWKLGDTDGTVMLRMPLHPVAIELLRKTGPLAVSSANITRHAPAQTIEEAQTQLGDAVSVYLDAGSATRGIPSSIVEVSGTVPHLLRDGAVPADLIAEVLGMTVEDLRAGSPQGSGIQGE